MATERIKPRVTQQSQDFMRKYGIDPTYVVGITVEYAGDTIVKIKVERSPPGLPDCPGPHCLIEEYEVGTNE